MDSTEYVNFEKAHEYKEIYAEVIKYFYNKKTVSPAELQKKFSLGFIEAIDFIRILTESELVKPNGKNTYTFEWNDNSKIKLKELSATSGYENKIFASILNVMKKVALDNLDALLEPSMIASYKVIIPVAVSQAVNFYNSDLLRDIGNIAYLCEYYLKEDCRCFTLRKNRFMDGGISSKRSIDQFDLERTAAASELTFKLIYFSLSNEALRTNLVCAVKFFFENLFDSKNWMMDTFIYNETFKKLETFHNDKSEELYETLLKNKEAYETLCSEYGLFLVFVVDSVIKTCLIRDIDLKMLADNSFFAKYKLFSHKKLGDKGIKPPTLEEILAYIRSDSNFDVTIKTREDNHFPCFRDPTYIKRMKISYNNFFERPLKFDLDPVAKDYPIVTECAPEEYKEDFELKIDNERQDVPMGDKLKHSEDAAEDAFWEEQSKKQVKENKDEDEKQSLEETPENDLVKIKDEAAEDPKQMYDEFVREMTKLLEKEASDDVDEEEDVFNDVDEDDFFNEDDEIENEEEDLDDNDDSEEEEKIAKDIDLGSPSPDFLSRLLARELQAELAERALYDDDDDDEDEDDEENEDETEDEDSDEEDEEDSDEEDEDEEDDDDDSLDDDDFAALFNDEDEEDDDDDDFNPLASLFNKYAERGRSAPPETPSSRLRERIERLKEEQEARNKNTETDSNKGANDNYDYDDETLGKMSNEQKRKLLNNLVDELKSLNDGTPASTISATLTLIRLKSNELDDCIKLACRTIKANKV